MSLVEGAGFEARVVGRGAQADSDSAMLRVSGMTCSSCSSAVEQALLNHKGVQVCMPLSWLSLLQQEPMHPAHWTIEAL